MSNRIVTFRHKKTVFGLLALSAGFLFAASSFAASYTSLKIYPENIGVFLTTGEQQFVCFGVTATGAKVNITDSVDWISSDEKLVKIDEDGLATIQPLITWGQVKVTCSYPKTGGGGANTGANHLLLRALPVPGRP